MISTVSWEVYKRAIEKEWANSLKQGLNKEANNMTKIDITKKVITKSGWL